MKTAKHFLLFVILLFIFITPITSFAETNEPTTYSPACVLMEASTGKILYEKNSNEIRYPASTTKIMTAIMALEKCELTDIATVSHNAIFSVPPSYAHANLQEGEELTIEQLLNVLLIPSANDAANVLAEHIGGSIEEFANMVNEKAKEIGCKNTHFVNPNGVHSNEHVTTAYDLALMGRYAMKNSTFRNIVKKTSYRLPTTNKYDKTDRAFNTSNELIRENHSSKPDNYYYPNAIGIKTGYTSEAGSCIVAGAEKDGMELIVVILGGQSTENGLSQRYLDCKNLFDYGFSNYSIQYLQKRNSVLEQITIRGADTDTRTLDVIVKDDISVLMNKGQDEYNVAPTITYEKNLKAPISANSVIGKISYNIDGKEYSSELLAGGSVNASNFIPILFRVLLIIVVLYLLYLLLRPSKNISSRCKKKRKNTAHTANKSKKHSSKKSSRGNGNFKFTQLK